MENETIAQRAERLVRQEVGHCVSSLVATIATMELIRGADQAALIEEAQQLCVPLSDYEEAALEHGWNCNPQEDAICNALESAQYESWQDCCEGENFDPYEREILEHWIVSPWLADKLETEGERVGMLGDLHVWGRTTGGQSISIDSVIETIAANCLKFWEQMVARQTSTVAAP